MRVWLFIACIMLLLAACGSNKVPADILPANQMETVLWQLMQSDEYVNLVLAKDSSKKSSVERQRIYQQVFDLNNISEEAFKKSYRFYTEHPDISKLMFDSIIARAARQRIDLLQPKQDSLARRADSINRVKADSIARLRVDSLHRRPLPALQRLSKGTLLTDSNLIKQRAMMRQRRRKPPVLPNP